MHSINDLQRSSCLPYAARRRFFPRCSISGHTTSSSDDSGGVLIVGGGPAGLAAARMLQQRGFQNITVVEKAQGLAQQDPSRSYVYSIDGRGRKCTDMFGLTPLLADVGLPMSTFKLLSVPISGPAKTVSLSIKDPNRESFWMPRRVFMEVLATGLDGFQIITGSEVRQIEKIDQDGSSTLRVHVVSDGGVVRTFEPRLIVGSDGVKSIVRRSLAEWEAISGNSSRFRMVAFDSPAAGLRYKVLQAPPNPWGNKDKTFRLDNSIGAVFMGKKGMRLGMLPLKDPERSRTANIILRPEHPFWEIKTKEELYSFLEDSFPQADIRYLISEAEAEKCVSDLGGSFPPPQYCEGIQWTAPYSPNSKSPAQQVILLGDALHCFPPDLGQGVNSALEDVYELDKVLEECNDDLAKALPLFEERRMDDVRALVRLVQIGYPYQYNQDQVGKMVWTLGFLGRNTLNKLIPSVFHPPSFLMVQDWSLSYSTILDRADETTRRICVLIGGIGTGLLSSILILSLVGGEKL